MLVKVIKFLKLKLLHSLDWVVSYCIFYSNGIQFSTFKNHGWPIVNVGLGGVVKIGNGFRSNNRVITNSIGRFNKCSIIVSKNGYLLIGNNVGMSSTAIVCHERIEIEDNVKIGGNVVIYDTDFHSLNFKDRLVRDRDIDNTKTAPIIIKKNAFIGAHATILKGVTVGENAVVGACSVISKDVPSNEIWAGNPAKRIK